jgi:hypothetical protein
MNIGQEDIANRDFAEAFAYGYQLADFELLRIEFEAALNAGDVVLVEKLAPRLTAAMNTIQESHRQAMEKMHELVASIANVTKETN